ncbi:MAG: DUF6178 family protein [Thermodesulfobacteriota bacterium]
MTDEEKTITPRSGRAPLAADQARILALEPQEALDAVLSHPRAGALVRSMPEEDLFVLVHEIGPDDCLEILSMASPDQWRFFLDMDGWREDLMEFSALNGWLERLYRVDADRLATMLAGTEREFFELWLSAYVTVIPLTEHDDPSDLAGEAFTLDGALYLKPKFTPGVSDAEKERVKGLLSGLLRRVADRDFPLFQAIVMESSGMVPGETREDLFRQRNVRLAEQGFAPPHEAVAVYQHMAPDSLLRSPRRALPREGEQEPTPVLLLPPVEGRAEPFTDALALVKSGNALWALQAEFAGLCNLLLSADRVTVRSRDDLNKTVRKAAGYTSLGLDALCGDNPARAADILSTRPLASVFRVGYSRALDLKFAAERFRKAAWFTREKVPLTFFGERHLGVLGGLLLARPKFFANYEQGLLYREFETPGDLIKTEDALSEAREIDGLFARLDLPPGLAAVRPMTWDRALLTLFARKQLGLAPEASPVPMDGFRKLWPKLWSGRGKARTISAKTRQAFFDFIREQAKKEGGDALQNPALGRALDALISRLAAEYAKVGAKDLDPRFLPHFWVAGNES